MIIRRVIQLETFIIKEFIADAYVDFVLLAAKETGLE
jgi:hypothetical protein